MKWIRTEWQIVFVRQDVRHRQSVLQDSGAWETWGVSLASAQHMGHQDRAVSRLQDSVCADQDTQDTSLIFVLEVRWRSQEDVILS